MRSKIIEIPPEIYKRKKTALEKMYEQFMNNPGGIYTQYVLSDKIGNSPSGTFTKKLQDLIKSGIVEPTTCPTCKRDKVYRLKPKSSQKKKKQS